MAIALCLAQGCASGDSLRSELLFDSKHWNQEAIASGFAAAGLEAKPIKAERNEGCFEAKGVCAVYSMQSDGKVKVVLTASGEESKQLLPAIENGIGKALVPKDVIRKRK